MTVFLIIVGGLAVLFFLFVLVNSFAGCYLRRDGPPLEKLDLSKTHYAKYKDDLLKAITEVKSLPYEPVRITAKDGAVLAARYFDFGNKKTVIALHGYRAIPYNNIHAGFLGMKDLGYNVLLVSQRCHFESGGHAITFGVKEKDDLIRWIEYLENRFPENEIALYGISMGCATICLAADKLKEHPAVKLLVLESGYRVAYEAMLAGGKSFGVLKYLIGFCCRLSGRTLLHVRLKENVMDEKLSQCTVPAFFIHGSEDANVTPDNSYKNFDAIASTKKELFIAEGAGHAEAFLAERPEITKRLKAFLEGIGDN
ncbi:MAG: hypothetical protein J5921_02995 [Clostridia bacterium]|nr:hypothetical protein [Clostridia bacterium]